MEGSRETGETMKAAKESEDSMRRKTSQDRKGDLPCHVPLLIIGPPFANNNLTATG